MTLYKVIDTLKMLSTKHPNINSAYEGNIYDIMNANPSLRYACFVITQQSHVEDEMYDHYGFTLFYVDRLIDDIDSNRVQIQSNGKSMLSNIIKAFCDEFDAECDRINFQTFTERFADECSGVYCTITIDMLKDIYCTEKYWDEYWNTPLISIRNQNKSVEFTENGTYTIEYDAENYTGLGRVSVEVNVPDLNGSFDDGFQEGYSQGKEDGYDEGKVDGYFEGKNDGLEEGVVTGKEQQKALIQPITITENGVYSSENGYSPVTVNLDIDSIYEEGKQDGIDEQKSKLESITITENGIYTKDDGYNTVEVELPIQKNKVADIRTNGTYVVKPDDNYVALEQLTLNVEAKSKVSLPNGISFADSTFTDFPVENYDWSSLLSTPYMFYNCANLNSDNIIKALNDNTIPTLHTTSMFENARVTKIEGVDFTKYYNCDKMFYNIIDLDEIKNCKFPYYDNTYNLISCPNKYFKLIDCDISNIKDYKFLQLITNWYFGRFQNVDNLEELPYNTPVNNRVFVMECDKPSTLKTTSTPQIWYDATKYSGWDEFNFSYPYGFTYNVISKDKSDFDIMIKQRDTETKFSFEQIIPYNEEKGCHYIDYPYYMLFDVYINGVKIDDLRDKFNTNIYIPSTDVGVYEGGDIKYLIYYALNSDYYEVNDNGLFVLKRSETSEKQRIITPTDAIKITATAGRYYIYVTKNGVRTMYSLKTTEETEHIIDTSDCDYIDVTLYVYEINNTYIRKIEIL